MKKITALMLSFVVICSCFTACKKDETVDSFLSGEIWEAILKPSNASSDNEGHIIAYQFKEDGTFLFYQSVDKSGYQSFVVTAGGYYEHDESNEKIILSSGDKTNNFEISYKYNEDTGILALNGPVAYFFDGTKEDVTLNFAMVSEEDKDHYKEDATMSYKIEEQATTK